ncbi:hypothetical protein [Novosphingobium sp. TCA1]|uniref:hypothetical protein n=1 Tax=Novosphingobium sp. TCA1 TaxID=2682474 RepID=UPI00130C3041|nr:hypothetical protein [Novosphingobium sp. TCA1]GFE73962.1 hypothetical protein NTCA1_16110 [Novosphingobium sp. TCA1]
MKRLEPLQAVLLCGAVGVLAIPAAVCFGADKGSVAIAGVGALGQVVVAVLLYYLTREQLDHARTESEYRKIEQRMAKQERRIDAMRRVQATFANGKTGIGKTKCDEDQIERLDRLRDDMRHTFVQPVSEDFNKMVEAAKAASQAVIGDSDYLAKIATFSEKGQAVYSAMKGQIDEVDRHIADMQSALEKL